MSLTPLVFGNDANIKDSRGDENVAGSRCGTNDAEDAQNIWSKYHQHVDESEQNERNGDLTQPAERPGGGQRLLDGCTYRKQHDRYGQSDGCEDTQNECVSHKGQSGCKSAAVQAPRGLLRSSSQRELPESSCST